MNEATEQIAAHIARLETALVDIVKANGLPVVTNRNLALALHGKNLPIKGTNIALAFTANNYDSTPTLDAIRVVETFQNRFYQFFRQSLGYRFANAALGDAFFMLGGHATATIVTAVG